MVVNAETNGDAAPKLIREPLKYSGSLDHLEYFEVTPLIGREYPKTQLKDIINAPNAEQMIRDLAIIISERGVVFFRKQDLEIDAQKKFTNDLGRLTGRPEENSLYRHPLFYSPENSNIDENGKKDAEIYVISSETQGKLYKDMMKSIAQIRDASFQWHTDSTYEVCPADYSVLKLHEVAPTGGDTMFGSQYEVYDRMSPSWRSYMETLTATCAQPIFKISADKVGVPIMEPRGSPLNVGDHFSESQPVVRTNPVTGWKGLYVIGLHVSRINDVTDYEDQMIRDYFMRLLTRNHDIQCRIKWGPDDMALWDNRSVYHSATPDMGILGGRRTGHRAASMGEKPYLDPASKSRREALAAAGM